MSLLRYIARPLLDTIEASRPIPMPPDEARHPPDLLIRPTSSVEAITRAEDWVGRPSRYRLGGGADVTEEHPFAADGTCDCSGFTAHVTGHARVQVIDGQTYHYNTDGVIRDACRFGGDQWRMTGGVVGDGPSRLYRRVTLDEDIMLGDLLVRAGRYAPRALGGRRVAIGHIGIVTGIGLRHERTARDWWRHLRMVHCRPNRGRKSAVPATDARPWRTRSYVVRPRWYVA